MSPPFETQLPRDFIKAPSAVCAYVSSDSIKLRSGGATCARTRTCPPIINLIRAGHKLYWWWTVTTQMVRVSLIDLPFSGGGVGQNHCAAKRMTTNPQVQHMRNRAEVNTASNQNDNGRRARGWVVMTGCPETCSGNHRTRCYRVPVRRSCAASTGAPPGPVQRGEPATHLGHPGPGRRSPTPTRGETLRWCPPSISCAIRRSSAPARRR